MKVVQQVNVPQETSANNWRTLKPEASLKPNHLEKESTHLEAVHFTKSFQNYILDGYAGNLEEIMKLILDESSGRNPLHQRRIELMRVKKTGSHSDFFST